MHEIVYHRNESVAKMSTNINENWIEFQIGQRCEVTWKTIAKALGKSKSIDESSISLKMRKNCDRNESRISMRISQCSNRKIHSFRLVANMHFFCMIPIVQLHHIQFLSDKSHFSVYQTKIHRTNDDAHELRREEEGNRAEHGTDNPVISTSGWINTIHEWNDELMLMLDGMAEFNVKQCVNHC